MKKFFRCAFFSVFILLISCTTSNDEESKDLLSKKGIHVVPNHGTRNIPLSVFREENIYHMLYSTGSEEWGHLTSPNMIHWSFEGSVEVPNRNLGDIVSTKLAGDTTHSWIMYYQQDGLKALIAANQSQWVNYELEVVGDVEGIPKINKGFDENWIMTTTNEETISFYRSSDLKTWSLYNVLPNDYSAEYSELVIIQEEPFLLINGYSAHIAMKFEDERFSIIGEKSTMVNQSFGTSMVLEGVTYLFYSLGDKVFSTPIELEVGEENELYLSPSKLLRNQTLVKRRGRLNGIIGDDMCTWFSFEIDSLDKDSRISITNEFNEKIEATIDRKENTYQLNFDGKRVDFAVRSEDPRVSVDIIIDHHYIGLFINKQQHVGSISKTENFLNKILVQVDGLDANPRSIVYTISKEPNQ